MVNNPEERLGELLKKFNYINDLELKDAIKNHKKSNKSFSEFLVDHDYLDEEELIHVMEIQLGLPRADLYEYVLGPNLAQYIPENIAKYYKVVPLQKSGNDLKVAMAEPNDIIAIDDMALASNLKIKPYIATRKEIKRAQGLIYSMVGHNTDDIFANLSDNREDDQIELDELKEMVEDAPIVQLTNVIINEAVQMRASDIHIEPQEQEVKVRYRIDGVLRENMIVPKYSQQAFISRIKIMAGLDITKRKTPQDGRVKLNLSGLEVDMRVSTLPTVHGESVVIRVLEKNDNLLNIAKLGFSDKNLSVFKQMVYNPHGIILATGPTGSGKSTTLFAVLNELNSVEKKLITIEDPVEYQLRGINQVQVNPQAGLSFAKTLRSILRQDPDIIMVGEVRDEETAMISVRAALTGHLVLSSLHTNDAVSSITRLVEMGVPAYLVASTLRGVIAQRLVRRLCSNCKEEYSPDEKEFKLLALKPGEKLYKAKGCSKCNATGYSGRLAVQEVLKIDDDLAKMIANNKGKQEIKELAIEKGMITLLDDAKYKVIKGLTSYEELERVIVKL